MPVKKLLHPETDTAVDDTHLLVETLPAGIRAALGRLPLDELIEVVMDLGRLPEARFPDRVERLAEKPVSREELASVVAQVGEFSGDNRAGIERTLHRISAIRNRKGEVVGLTLRVGRAMFGTIELLRGLIETGQNLLILGRPGVGKTTKLREMARVLADDLGKRVIVIDTSNEIAGDGDIPHPGIGSARRMQVARPERQHSVMIEAVENHMPEVIIVDEIGTEAEAEAARTIAERGVQLIGTAHGNSLENLIVNPTLSDLVGGVQTVTLSDEEARRRGTTKTVSERRAPPTFDIVVEMVDRHEVIVHTDTAAAVDAILRGFPPRGERREQAANGHVHVQQAEPEPPRHFLPPAPPPRHEGPVRIFPYAISRDLVERVIRGLGINARTVGEAGQADLVLALRSRSDDSRLVRALGESHAQLHVIKRNTANEARRLLQRVFHIMEGVDRDETEEAVREVEAGIERAIREGVEVPLPPRPPALRRLQHRIVTGRNLVAQSSGREPQRHLVVYPPERSG